MYDHDLEVMMFGLSDKPCPDGLSRLIYAYLIGHVIGSIVGFAVCVALLIGKLFGWI